VPALVLLNLCSAERTHPVRRGVQNINCGCCTEMPSIYLTASNGWVEMHYFETMRLEMVEETSVNRVLMS
jgi:hypothetical protein